MFPFVTVVQCPQEKMLEAIANRIPGAKLAVPAAIVSSGAWPAGLSSALTSPPSPR